MKKFALFLGKVFAVSGLTLLVLTFINNRYEKVMDDPYTDTDKFNYMGNVYTNIQISNIGSSHGEYAFYYETLNKQQGYECFNFSMSSQTYDYDYALLSMYRQNFAENSLMFIPVSYFSFNDEVISETEKQSLGAKYYTFLSPFYIPDYDPFVDLVTHRFPVLSASTDLMKLFPSFLIKAEASELPTAEEFMKKGEARYKRHMTEKEEYFKDERIAQLGKILEFCQEKNITPVLITTPYMTYYSDLVSGEFKEEFRKTIEQTAASYGVNYYDYSEDERFNSHLDYFADADHLNTEGAIQFMGTIQVEIPEFANFLENNEPLHAGDSNWQPPY